MRSLLDALDDPPSLEEEVLAALRVQREGIEANMGTVEALMRPPGDPFHERLVAACPQIRRFLPALIEALEWQAIDSAAPVLDACHAPGQWLAGQPRTTRRPASEVPSGVVTPSWRPHVHDQDSDTAGRAACTCCVLDQVRTRLRRRAICAPGSARRGDPRAGLLTPRDWDRRRDALCGELALGLGPAAIAARLAASLGTAWRRTAGGYPASTGLRIETRGGRDEIVVTPLDAEAEPASLAALRGGAERLLPEVEIAGLPREGHGWTGFPGEYTPVSGTGTGEVHLPESLSALLVSGSCDGGLTPVVDETYPPLSRERLNWVGHSYLRSATRAPASVRLAGFHTPLPLAQARGGGEMASADGMRLVIPGSTITAACHPRYFGRQRGPALYS